MRSPAGGDPQALLNTGTSINWHRPALRRKLRLKSSSATGPAWVLAWFRPFSWKSPPSSARRMNSTS